MSTITAITHPEYDAMLTLWEKYRLTYEGGENFIDKYLTKYSDRESTTEFDARKEMSYCPAHAKAAVNDIKNAIFQRMTDIVRVGGPKTYIDATDGTDASGVDLEGNTMNSFIGRVILPELLTMAKVGVFVDKQDVEINTREDQKNLRPYIYYYRAEDIRSWAYDSTNQLSSVLLRDHDYTYDAITKLPNGEVERFRLVWKEDGIVKVQFFDNDGNGINREGLLSTVIYELLIPEIPFVIFTINASLMTDVADYQRALLNLASSDMHYALKSNFPFYTEQYNPNMEMDHLLRGPIDKAGTVAPGTGGEASIAKSAEARVGATKGRRYPKGMDRPDFIHPSSEPLIASMTKQKDLQQEIRQLVNLNLTNVDPRKASINAKDMDERGLESGLSYIGLELEYGERRIAQFWAYYEGSKEVTTIKYPEKYSLKSDADRNKEAEDLETSANMSPSLEYKKTAAKIGAELRIGHRVPATVLAAIYADIESADYIVFDSTILQVDLESGLVSPATASKIRGYNAGEVEMAAKAHAERLTRIAISQAKGGGAARGVADLGDPNDAVTEKKESRQTDQDPIPTDKTRGEGQ
jgi:hypothetical protein